MGGQGPGGGCQDLALRSALHQVTPGVRLSGPALHFLSSAALQWASWILATYLGGADLSSPTRSDFLSSAKCRLPAFFS